MLHDKVGKCCAVSDFFACLSSEYMERLSSRKTNHLLSIFIYWKIKLNLWEKKLFGTGVQEYKQKKSQTAKGQLWDEVCKTIFD